MLLLAAQYELMVSAVAVVEGYWCCDGGRAGRCCRCCCCQSRSRVLGMMKLSTDEDGRNVRRRSISRLQKNSNNTCLKDAACDQISTGYHDETIFFFQSIYKYELHLHKKEEAAPRIFFGKHQMKKGLNIEPNFATSITIFWALTYSNSSTTRNIAQKGSIRVCSQFFCLPPPPPSPPQWSICVPYVGAWSLDTSLASTRINPFLLLLQLLPLLGQRQSLQVPPDPLRVVEPEKLLLPVLLLLLAQLSLGRSLIFLAV